MTFTKFQWSINFCIFFSHISAGCQLIKKNKCWFIISILAPNIWQEYLWWSISFNFWVCHFLLHREVKKPNILERMSADFKNIGSFYIILEHFKFVCQQNCWSISFEGECNFYTQWTRTHISFIYFSNFLQKIQKRGPNIFFFFKFAYCASKGEFS